MVRSAKSELEKLTDSCFSKVLPRRFMVFFEKYSFVCCIVYDPKKDKFCVSKDGKWKEKTSFEIQEKGNPIGVSCVCEENCFLEILVVKEDGSVCTDGIILDFEEDGSVKKENADELDVEKILNEWIARSETKKLLN